MRYSIPLALFAALLITGCSTKNPFGIGYDKSVCTESSSFGVCGAPADIYKYREKIKSTQAEYMKAGLDTRLYFAISPEGKVLVKADRDGQFAPYDTSEWKKIIKERIHEEELKVVKTVPMVNIDSGLSDIPTTKETDLSVKYKKQGPLLVTRTKIGNIIRDQGVIQEAMIFNYEDTEGDLMSSHAVHVVVRDPRWIVGESVPKNVKLANIPTPLSTDLFKKQQIVDKEQEDTINEFNREKEDPRLKSIFEKKVEPDQNIDLSVIDNFLKGDK